MNARLVRLAATIAFSLAAASALAQTGEARGLDFRSYLSLERGMTEGQVLTIAGAPDLVTDQGAVRETERGVLALRTYTYLPTQADPYVATITLAGGKVTEIQRDRKF
ncbi:MAG: hypothetical protein ACREVQ_06960 [Burkholderiales bacterium]